MSLTFRCGGCGHQYTVPDQMAGKWVRCKHCDSTLEVPGPSPSNETGPTPRREAESRSPAQPTPKPPLKQARPISPQQSSPEPIPEAVLLPDPQPGAHPVPQQPLQALPASQPAVPTSRPAVAQPARLAPQPALPPLRPTPIVPAGRPRLATSRGDSIDKKMVILAVGTVGVVLAIVVLMMVVMFGGDSGNDHETAGRSPSDNGGVHAGANEPDVAGPDSEPRVADSAPPALPSAVDTDYSAPSLPDMSLPASPTPKKPEPTPTPGFLPSTAPATPRPSAHPPSRPVRAYVHLEIKSYPPSGNPQMIAQDALRSVLWVEPDSIRVDRAANELVLGVRIMAVNTNTAKLRLEGVGFVIGGASFKPVRN